MVDPGSRAAERKAVVFTAGGVRLAMPLSRIREIVALEEGATHVATLDVRAPALPVAVALGLVPGNGRFALVTAAVPPVALKVDVVHGIVDISTVASLDVPARTLLPQPPPFREVLVIGAEVALHLADETIGWVPLEPAREVAVPDYLGAPDARRELAFVRAGRCYLVPTELLREVVGASGIFPVPLTPPSHRGLLLRARSVVPVVDLSAPFTTPAGDGAVVLLVDGGSGEVGLLADRVLGAEETVPDTALRPRWGALL